MTRSHVDAVNALFDRSWWQRMWTVQESVLGVNLVFVCGRDTILVEQAFAVANGYFRHIYTCCQSVWHSVLDPATDLGNSCDTLVKLEGMRLHRHKYTFPQILSMFLARVCSNPHDKIYGLLGLASEEEAALITVDYANSIGIVYQDVAYEFLTKSGDLDFLSLQFPDNAKECSDSLQNLPTWVPNWALIVDPTLLYDIDDRFHCLRMYRASGNSRAVLEMSFDGGLLAKGARITTIETLSPREDPEDAADNLAAFFNNWREMVGINDNPNRLYMNSQTTTYSDAFWQTLCCSIVPDLEHPRDINFAQRTTDTSPHKRCFEAWWLWCEEYNCEPSGLQFNRTTYSKGEMNALGAIIFASISLRRLFVGRDRRIGLAPMNAKVGDNVMLLQGGRVPYVLRDTEFGDKYACEFIGDSYVHGVMDGEEWTGKDHQDLLDVVLV